jgi:hypothetical protein
MWLALGSSCRERQGHGIGFASGVGIGFWGVGTTSRLVLHQLALKMTAQQERRDATTGQASSRPESSRQSFPGLWIDRRISDPSLPCAERATGSSWRERMTACFDWEALVNPIMRPWMKTRRGSERVSNFGQDPLPHQVLWGGGPRTPPAAAIGNMNGMRLDGPWHLVAASTPTPSPSGKNTPGGGLARAVLQSE